MSSSLAGRATTLDVADGADRASLSAALVAWLLASREPAVRWLARTRVLGLDHADADVRRDRDAILDGSIVSTLLSFDDSDPSPPHPYAKWYGAHWRLVSLVELGIPAGDRRVHAALERVLGWLMGPGHRRGIRSIEGRVRRCASQEGNAVAVASRLGASDDPRVQSLAADLVAWQWPDGGWNCDVEPNARHSSFHESLPAMWGLSEYGRAAGDDAALDAAARTGEFLLRHRLFRSERDGKVIDARWLVPHHPPYWHYDTLRALTVLARAGVLPHQGANDAAEELLRRRRPDGTWRAGRRWWQPPGGTTRAEAIDWRVDATDDRLVTIAAVGALRATGHVSRTPRPTTEGVVSRPEGWPR